MLVLSRKFQEEVVVSMGDVVVGVVCVVEIRDNTVRLGFAGFDKSIAINRREIHDKVQERANATGKQDGAA